MILESKGDPSFIALQRRLDCKIKVRPPLWWWDLSAHHGTRGVWSMEKREKMCIAASCIRERSVKTGAFSRSECRIPECLARFYFRVECTLVWIAIKRCPEFILYRWASAETLFFYPRFVPDIWFMRRIPIVVHKSNQTFFFVNNFKSQIDRYARLSHARDQDGSADYRSEKVTPRKERSYLSHWREKRNGHSRIFAPDLLIRYSPGVIVRIG